MCVVTFKKSGSDSRKLFKCRDEAIAFHAEQSTTEGNADTPDDVSENGSASHERNDGEAMDAATD